MISEKKPDDRSQNAVRDGKFGSAEGILSARSAERHPPACNAPVGATVAGTTRRLLKGNLRRRKEHASL